MVRWRYASSRVVVAGLGRMGKATWFGPRSCARTWRRQAHDYRRRAGLLRAGELGSIKNKVAALPISHTGHELIRKHVRAESVYPSSADMRRTGRHVKFVPLAEVAGLIQSTSFIQRAILGQYSSSVRFPINRAR